jgi:hypothetical protein
MVIRTATATMEREIGRAELPCGSWTDGSVAEHVGIMYRAKIDLGKAEDAPSNIDSPRRVKPHVRCVRQKLASDPAEA